jgi:uncharacterized protein YjgD (DUF1641 family)
MNSLQSNIDLPAYMKRLAADLKAGGALDDAYRIADASQFSSGSASEFLHEARNALAGILQSHEKGLTAIQMEDLRSVIRQIDDAFRKIGGA